MSERRDGAGSGRRIDLSLTQVVASALAAVVGAVLASELGVYGTVIGAAVVSIGATCGGAVFQHLFRRTGEQLREVTDRSPARTVNGLRQVPAGADAPPVARSGDRGPAEPPLDGSWSESPVQRAGRRRWKGYAAISVLVFALAMAPIVVVELAAGKNMHSITTGEDGGGTSILPDRSGAASPDRPPAPREAPAQPSPALPAAGPSGSPSGRPADPSPSPSGSATGSPSAPPSSPVPTPSTGSPSAAPSGWSGQPTTAPATGAPQSAAATPAAPTP